ncbi:hypothetical protein EB001_11140 [bacterium]|jgi:hypothetical protein|nr:hypothetical protein [bacterium]
MNSQEELELDQEEIEYFMLKYIQEQTKNGKKYVEAREIYEYLGAEMPEDLENEKIVLHPSAAKFIKEYEAKNRPYLN